MIQETLKKRDWLTASISQHIVSFKNLKEKNKKRAFYTKITIALFSLIITLLLCLSLIFTNPYLKTISIVLAASVTIVSTINAFFDFESLWVKYNEALNKLYGIRDDLNYYLEGKPDYEVDVKIMDEYKERLNLILDETNKSWRELKKNNL
nr:SLATT domain-containing protein [uncultured Psychroserpens sp.]